MYIHGWRITENLYNVRRVIYIGASSIYIYIIASIHVQDSNYSSQKKKRI